MNNILGNNKIFPFSMWPGNNQLQKAQPGGLSPNRPNVVPPQTAAPMQPNQIAARQMPPPMGPPVPPPSPPRRDSQNQNVGNPFDEFTDYRSDDKYSEPRSSAPKTRSPSDFMPHHWAAALTADDPRLQWPHPASSLVTGPDGFHHRRFDFSSPIPNSSAPGTGESFPALHSPSMRYIGSPGSGITFALDNDRFAQNMPKTKLAPGVYQDDNTGRHYVVKTGMEGAQAASIPMRGELVAHKLYKALATEHNGIAPIDARLHSDELGGAEVPPGTKLSDNSPVYSVTQRQKGVEQVYNLPDQKRRDALKLAAKGWIVDALLAGGHGDLHDQNILLNEDGTGIHRIDTGGLLGSTAWGHKDPSFWGDFSQHTLLPSMQHNLLSYNPQRYSSPKDTIRQIKEVISSWDQKQKEIQDAISYHPNSEQLLNKLNERVDVLRRAYKKYKNDPEQLWKDLSWPDGPRIKEGEESITRPIDSKFAQTGGPRNPRPDVPQLGVVQNSDLPPPPDMGNFWAGPQQGLDMGTASAQRRQRIFRDMIREAEARGETGAQRFLFDNKGDIPESKRPADQIDRVNRLWGNSAAGFRQQKGDLQQRGRFGPINRGPMNWEGLHTDADEFSGETRRLARREDELMRQNEPEDDRLFPARMIVNPRGMTRDVRHFLQPRVEAFLSDRARRARGEDLTSDSAGQRARARRYQFWKEQQKWKQEQGPDQSLRDDWFRDNPDGGSRGRGVEADWRSDADPGSQGRRFADEPFEEWKARQLGQQRDLNRAREQRLAVERAMERRRAQGAALLRQIQQGNIDPQDISAGRFGNYEDMAGLGPQPAIAGMARQYQDWNSRDGQYGQEPQNVYEGRLMDRKMRRLEAEGRGGDPAAWDPREKTRDAWGR